MNSSQAEERTSSHPAAADRQFDQLICEISAKLEAGDAVELADYEREHAEFATRLRRLWPTLTAMVKLGHITERSGSATAKLSRSPGDKTLGDFRIIREVGRGGMGVVYEAEQLSLNRRVALKVLPFASVLDQRQLQRFKNEALAAAALDHPNIVGVHTTGCERAVHFYAMHLIDGQTMAELIGQLRKENLNSKRRKQGVLKRSSLLKDDGLATPIADQTTETNVPCQALISTEGSVRSREFFRAAVKLAIQAAEAIDHAHSMGVIHRDIKPSNLLIDDNGHLWVTDFGLAAVESNCNLTMTGDILGTLRYMSPEQALAKRVVVDHRTDIFSLGVTLYELLTLEPAYSGSDRQELLRQLAFEEPKSPRQLNTAIPTDLETIILTAMAKNPAERYATAADLAGDLERFLNDQPIHARRPGALALTQKWIKRHKVLSMAVAAMIVVVLAGTAAFKLRRDQRSRELTLLVSKDLAAAQASLDALDFDQANRRIHSAEVRLQQANIRTGPLLAQAEVLEKDWSAKTQARNRFDEFQKLHNSLHSSLREESAGTQKKLIESIKGYGVLDGSWPQHPDHEHLTAEQETLLKQALAESLFHAGLLELQISRDRPAEIKKAARRRAVDYWNRVEDFHRRSIPALYLFIAESYDILEEPELAASARAKAMQREDRTLLDFYVRGQYLRRRDKDTQAMESFSRCLRLDPGHIWSLLATASTLNQIGKSDVAEAVCTHVLDRFPSSRAAYYKRGVSLLGQGKFDLAVEDFEMVHKLNPDDYLGSFWAGMSLFEKGDTSAAQKQFEKAAQINPGSGWVPLKLGEAYQRSGRREVAIQQFDKSIENCNAVIDDYEFAQLLSTKAHLQRARLHLSGGKREAAQSDVKKACEIASNYSHRHALREVAWFLATGPEELRDPQKGIPLARKAVEEWTKDRRGPLFTLGVLYYEAGQYVKAVETFESVNEYGVNEHPRAHFVLAAANWKIEKRDEARKWYDRGVEAGVKSFRQRATKIIKNGEVTLTD